MIDVAIEGLEEHLEEIKPLLPLCHAEVERFQDRMPLDPNYPEYLRLAAADQLVLVVARQDGRIVGFSTFLVVSHLHHRSTLFGMQDVIYLAPAHRGDGTGGRIRDVMAAELKRRGVGPMIGGSKNNKSIDWLYEDAGFERFETLWARWL